MNVAKARDRQLSRRENAGIDMSTFVREAALATGWIRLDTAVVSSRGRSHAVNEDWYSVLDGPRPLFVVADGVGSGAMASYASRELVLHLHARALCRDCTDEQPRSHLPECAERLRDLRGTRSRTGAGNVQPR